MLEELKDLPQQAEAEIRDMAGAKQKIKELETQLRHAAGPKTAASKADPAELRSLRTTAARLRKGLEDAMKALEAVGAVAVEPEPIDAEQVKRVVEAAAGQLVALVQKRDQKRAGDLGRIKREAQGALAKLQQLLGGQSEQIISGDSVSIQPIDFGNLPDDDVEEIAGGALDQRILDAIAWWEAIGVENPTREQVGFAAQCKPRGGYFGNTLGAMRTNGLITYPSPGVLTYTDAGRARAVSPQSPPTYESLIARARSVIRQAAQRKIFDALVKAGRPVSRDDLSESVEMRGGYYGNTLGAMRSSGIIDYPSPGMVGLSSAFKFKG